jgi:hypothetical protein
VLLAALVAAVAGWVGVRLWLSGGHEVPTVPWTTPGVLLLVAVAVVVLGWPVRRWTRGHRDRPLDPLRAARTVVLAKAAQYAGALFAGWYLGLGLAVLPTVDVGPRRSVLLRAAVTGVAAVVVWLAGVLVERWCRVDDSGDHDEQSADREARR